MSFASIISNGGLATTIGPVVSGSSLMQNMTNNATPNTFGAYVELSPSIPYDCDGFWYMARSSSSFALIELSVGESGVQVPICEYLPVLPGGNNANGTFIPLSFRRGMKLWARSAGASSHTIRLQMQIVPSTGRFPRFTSRVESLGLTLSTLSGSVATSGAANVKGGWQEIVANTPARLRWIVPVQPNLSTGTNRDALFDIGVGSMGNEFVVIPDLHANTIAVNGFLRTWGPFFVDIPRAARLSHRLQVPNNFNGNTLELFILAGY